MQNTANYCCYLKWLINIPHFLFFTTSSLVPGGGTSIPLIDRALPRSGRKRSTKCANRLDEFWGGKNL